MRFGEGKPWQVPERALSVDLYTVTQNNQVFNIGHCETRATGALGEDQLTFLIKEDKVLITTDIRRHKVEIFTAVDCDMVCAEIKVL